MTTTAEMATLVHGYTMADVEDIANHACRISFRFGGYHLDESDRRETAWFAVVEHLYTAAAPPPRADLLGSGVNALTRAINAQLREAGWNSQAAAERANFVKYWRPRGGETDFTDRLVELLTLPQLLGCLSDVQYEAIAALAAHGSAISAAKALDMNYQSFYSRILAARRKCLAAWFDDETPPRPKDVEDTCRVGHARAEHGYRHVTSGAWQCRKCANDALRRRRARDR